MPKAEEPPPPGAGTAIAKPEPRDELLGQLLDRAKSPDERALAFDLAATARKHAMVQEAAKHVSATTWGKDLSEAARKSFARWALEMGTDPVRHWTLLGGRVYDLAELYYDLIASQPDFDHDEFEYLHDDLRAPQEERDRRRLLRVQLAVPDEMKGACRVTLIFKGRGPFIGVNWAGSRGKKQDPVGDQDPEKTAYTRAFRKAAKKAVPLWFERRAADLGPRRAHVEALISSAKANERGELASVVALPPGQAAATEAVAHPERRGVVPAVDPDDEPKGMPETEQAELL